MSVRGGALRLRRLGLVDYEPVWRAMQGFTTDRGPETADELWLLEHPPIYTLGQAGRTEHLLNPGAIPVLEVDRGGQVTYHGPGQLIAYLLLDLHRAHLGVRALVNTLERAVVKLLAAYGIPGSTRPGAPGVYVREAKVASLGIRVRRGCCYHGLALNVDMDLEPFSRINPCGYPGLPVTQLREQGGPLDLNVVGDALAREVAQLLNLRPEWEQCASPSARAGSREI